MNEIERAIETLERRLMLDKFNLYQAASNATKIEHEKEIEATKTAITILRAELSRQENAPLTCDGCANLPTKYGSGVYMNAPCRVCVRGITTRDYYKSAVEPKGEKE